MNKRTYTATDMNGTVHTITTTRTIKAVAFLKLASGEYCAKFAANAAAAQRVWGARTAAVRSATETK